MEKKTKEHKWSEKKGWKKPKSVKKQAPKLLEEGNHLIGPADNLIDSNDSHPQS